MKEEKVREQTEEEIEEVPEFGTTEWIYLCSNDEGVLPSPIDISITGSLRYICPELKWYNFDVYPHKIKMTNTGFTVLIGAKWKTERPYLEGGPLLEKHVLSQIHFHWGANMTEGSEHTVDKRRYPAEMQVTFFRSEYLTQEEAFKHPDGVLMICYLIKFAVNDDARLSWVLEGFPRIKEPHTHTRIGPYPMSHLLPMFYEDYFLYWGRLDTSNGDKYVLRWLIPRTNLSASFNQMAKLRTVWNAWDEPLIRNYRPLQPRKDRHVFFISPHWNQYNSLLPIPRVPEPSISVLSDEYQTKLWMLPPQNAYMLPPKEKKENTKTTQPETEEEIV